jgi:hypothetical protein
VDQVEEVEQIVLIQEMELVEQEILLQQVHLKEIEVEIMYLVQIMEQVVVELEGKDQMYQLLVVHLNLKVLVE